MSARFIVGETAVVRLRDGSRPRVQLCEILGAPDTPGASWSVRLQDGSIADIADDSLLERVLLVRYPCRCCGYLTIVTFGHAPPGTYTICPVCRWEDDYLTSGGGANRQTIEEVRADFEAWRDAGMPHDSRRREPLVDEMPRHE